MEELSRSLQFVTLRPDSWDDTIDLARHLNSYLFRGQMDARWNLTTSLERATPDYNVNSEFLKNREFWILKEFQRRSHRYISKPPENNELIEWLSFIQHHGGPTRLLDFTRSFYVAVFFAIEMAQNDAAVWAVNGWKLDVLGQKYAGEISITETVYHSNQRRVSFANRCVSGEVSTKFILRIEPDKLNERIAAQQGLFLFPCDLTASFEENIFQTFGQSLALDFNSVEPILYTRNQANIIPNKFDVLKIIIPRNIHTMVINELYNMNISAANLFPGLDGLARSLHYHLRALDE